MKSHLETNNEYLFDDTLSENDLDLMRKLDDIYANSDKLAIKKLSKNDRAWAWPKPTNKQAGFYIPLEFRGEFFPSDQDLQRRSDQ